MGHSFSQFSPLIVSSKISDSVIGQFGSEIYLLWKSEKILENTKFVQVWKVSTWFIISVLCSVAKVEQDINYPHSTCIAAQNCFVLPNALNSSIE